MVVGETRKRRGTDELAFGSFMQSFHCRHGKAYLFNDVVNVKSGKEGGWIWRDPL